MNPVIEQEYNEQCWVSYKSDHPDMTEDDAIRFWANQLTLMPACYMSQEQVLYALTRYYGEDEQKASEAMERRRKEAEQYNGVCDLDYLIP